MQRARGSHLEATLRGLGPGKVDPGQGEGPELRASRLRQQQGRHDEWGGDSSDFQNTKGLGELGENPRAKRGSP